MALYIVVHHPDNPNNAYSNAWTSNNRLLEAITTPQDVALLLEAEKARGRRVYVHRCAGPEPARICCSLEVDKIVPLGDLYYVSFINPESLDLAPPRPAHQGQNYYVADTPE